LNTERKTEKRNPGGVLSDILESLLPEKELLFEGTPAIRGEHKEARYCLYPLEGKYAVIITIGRYMKNWYLDTSDEYEAYSKLKEYVVLHREWMNNRIRELSNPL
jgi:hypothetical protein